MQTISENRDMLELNYKLMQLQEVDIEADLSPEDVTITFTNSSTSNTDLQINVKIINR